MEDPRLVVYGPIPEPKRDPAAEELDAARTVIRMLGNQIREMYEWADCAWSSRVKGNRVAAKMRELWPWLSTTDSEGE